MVQAIGPFGTLNNTDNPITLSSDKAQDLLNVDLTEDGKSVKKRAGYALENNLTYTTSPVHGVYQFFDSNGNDIALYFNDTYLTASINHGSPVVIFSTGLNGKTYQCIDSQGFAYCANSGRANIVKTDGVTASSLFVLSTGTMVAVTPDRLVQAGFQAAPNRIDFSGSLDFTSWTTGVTPTSPFQFTITAPGSRITHITYAFNRIMWFKDNSFGYILQGQTQPDWVIKTISPNIGTLDNTSVYWKDILYWRGQDGHFYSYDGSSIEKLSRDIGGTVLLSQTRAQGLWNQSSSEDFGAGNFNPNIFGDSITVSGQFQLTFPDTFDTYRDGSSNTKPVWTHYNSGASVGTSSATAFLDIRSTGGALGRTVVRTTEMIPDFQVGTTFFFNTNITQSTGNLSRLYVVLSSNTSSTTNPDSLGSNFQFVLASTFTKLEAGDRFYVQSISNNIDGILYVGFATTTVTFQGSLSNFQSGVNFYLSTTTYRLTIGATLISAGTHNWTVGPKHFYFAYMNGSHLEKEARIDNFDVKPASFTFMSQVNNAPNLTEWDTFNVNFNNGVTGSNNFSIRASTNPIQVTSSTPSWTSLTNGSIPTSSTGSYFQIRDVIVVSSISDNAVVTDFNVRWFEGLASDKSYSTYFDDSILFSIAYGSGTTINNRIVKYDLLNSGYLIYDIGANGFYTSNLTLYFGSSTQGKIFSFGNSSTDNGSPINSYWKSKDFFSTDPFIDNDYKNLSVIGASIVSSTVAVTYSLNGSSSTVYSESLYESGKSFVTRNRNLPLGKNGMTFNVQVGNNAANNDFEIFGIRLGLNTKSWTPTK